MGNKTRVLASTQADQMNLEFDEPISDHLPCSFGTPFIDHFRPPIGTGKGCVPCSTPFYGRTR